VVNEREIRKEQQSAITMLWIRRKPMTERWVFRWLCGCSLQRMVHRKRAWRPIPLQSCYDSYSNPENI
jgi:hypothetical protein